MSVLLSPCLGWSHTSSLNLSTLPADVLFEITSYFNTLSDALHLSLSSSHLYVKVIPAIYAYVELQGPAQCEATLRMLQRCPEVARNIRRLVVRPETERGERRQVRMWDNAGAVSRMIVAAARHLDALQVFEWDGEDMLPDDRMWSDLRAWCPYLRHIATTFGCYLPRPSSHLFKFSDLSGFSLTFKDSFYVHQLHLPSRESEPVFSRLWDMLIEHCPNLEALSIAGTSAEPSDVLRIQSARWPRLRVLSVGDVICGLSAPINPPPFHPFLAFLERHPSLESLHILGHPNVNPLDFVELPRDALPQLSEFSGSLDHLKALLERGRNTNGNANANPNALWPDQASRTSSLSKTLRHLCLPEPMQLRELTPLSISRVLMDLGALTSLKITFALHSGYDSTGVFRTIIASCPQLLHLDLTCTSKPSFYLESFSRSLRKLSRLRTLHLRIVKFPGEEPMHTGAARIALANPRLTHFTIAYLPPHTHTPALPPPLERGTFELVCDRHGIPVSLCVSEWRAALWGARGSGLERVRAAVDAVGMALGVGAGGAVWRAGPHGWTRWWICELRPSGHPDVEKRGLVQLLLERSPAGEEARLLTFCLSLLLLTLWGVLWRAVV